jgi:DNA ligase (NAD+)
VAKRLVNAFHSIEELMNASYEQLIAVEEIGDRIANSVIAYFADESNRNLIERLKFHSLQFALGDEVLAGRTDTLQGQTFVISGTFSIHSRDEYKELIEKNGGKNASSVSAKTNFILAGENMGPAKLEKAQKLGIKIINEKEFLAML